MEFAKNLRELRRRKGLTQEQLANLVNVSSQAVSKWETSDTLPDTALLPEIARSLDTSIDALFSYQSSDKMNVYHAVRTYINESVSSEKSELSEQLKRLFNLIVVGESAKYFDEEELSPEYWDFGKLPYDDEVASSQIGTLCDEGTSWVFNSKLFPYAAVFLKPEQGYAKIFADNKKIEKLFTAMGDPDVYQCVMYLLSEKSENITLSALMEKLKISPLRMEEIGEKLSYIDARSIKMRDEIINGEVYKIVSYNHNGPGIQMLLAAAYACCVSQYATRHLSPHRDNPIL